MPFKDPVKRAEKAREYARKSMQKSLANKLPGECSVYNCHRPRDGKHKKCLHHLEYMRKYKKPYREANAKTEGMCAGSDCRNMAEPGIVLCRRCNDRANANSRLRTFRGKRKEWEQQIKKGVFEKLGNKCACCGNSNFEFLTVDHIDPESTKTTPRGGFKLYLWLHNQGGVVEGFRLLCMNCNFMLGHHGKCHHSDFTQTIFSGRRAGKNIDPKVQKYRKEYWIRYKIETLSQYGGPKCVCCGEEHIEYLTLDHIGKTGAEHRKSDPQAKNLYVLLRQSGYPPGYRVLCMNCNFSLGVHGYCPHNLDIWP